MDKSGINVAIDLSIDDECGEFTIGKMLTDNDYNEVTLNADEARLVHKWLSMHFESGA